MEGKFKIIVKFQNNYLKLEKIMSQEEKSTSGGLSRFGWLVLDKIILGILGMVLVLGLQQNFQLFEIELAAKVQKANIRADLLAFGARKITEKTYKFFETMESRDTKDKLNELRKIHTQCLVAIDMTILLNKSIKKPKIDYDRSMLKYIEVVAGEMGETAENNAKEDLRKSFIELMKAIEDAAKKHIEMKKKKRGILVALLTLFSPFQDDSKEEK